MRWSHGAFDLDGCRSKLRECRLAVHASIRVRNRSAKKSAVGLEISRPDGAYSLGPSNPQPVKPYGASVSGRLRDPWKMVSSAGSSLELRPEQRPPPRAGLARALAPIDEDAQPTVDGERLRR